MARDIVSIVIGRQKPEKLFVGLSYRKNKCPISLTKQLFFEKSFKQASLRWNLREIMEENDVLKVL